MAFDPHQADRIRQIFKAKKIDTEEKKMIGGLCFMVDDKMCCGTHIDKNTKNSLLMARIGESAAQKHIDNSICLPLDNGGKRMKDFVYVTSDGIDFDEDLEHWIELCMDFNPLAKSSKKRKSK